MSKIEYSPVIFWKDSHSRHGLRLQIPAMVLMLALLSACGGKEEAPAAPSNENSSSPAASESALPPSQESENNAPAPAGGGNDILAGFNPCEMLTQAEVESFFEEPMATDAAPESIGPYRSCMLTSQSGGKMIILQATNETADQFKADNESSASMFEVVPTPVAGLGDEAVFMSGLLRVRVGDQVFQVVTWHPEDQQDQAFSMTQEIARLALPHMP
jgi:hypothetical protein